MLRRADGAGPIGRIGEGAQFGSADTSRPRHHRSTAAVWASAGGWPDHTTRALHN